MKKSQLKLSNIDYYVVFLSTTLINFFAIFAFAIVLDYLKFSFIIRRVTIDDEEIKFKGELAEFFFLELKFKVLSYLTLGIYSLFTNGIRIKKYVEFTYFEEGKESNYNAPLLKNIANILFLGFVGILSLGTYLPFVLFKRKKFIIEHLEISDRKLFLDLKDQEYLDYLFRNIGLIIVTLGIYLFFFLPAYKRFITSRIRIL